MRYSAVLAGSALMASSVYADLCSAGSQEIAGNWYCQAVDTIQYSNFGSSGSYNSVTNMDSSTGACSSEPVSYSGSLAPLDGEVSVHFRGPLALSQFAVYTPGSAASKTKRSSNNHKRNAHAHAHLHAHDKEIREIQDADQKKRAVGDWVVVTMDGQVVSWINEFSGGAAAAAPTPDAGSGSPATNANNVVAAAAKATAAPYVPTASGDWVQTAVYDAAAGTAKGLTFLNNFGGTGSGVFDYTFGNSLSYASSSGTTGAASSEVLAETTIPSNSEVILMSDKPCSEGSGCGYVRPGTVAYHGFAGASKIFIAELSMPSDGTTGFNADMPAWWLLNAQIPRTLQYGNADCSCWTSGCGEFDIMEVLTSGETRCKSTLHAGVSGGDSDYIERPLSAPVKVALIMSDEKATIQVLDPSFEMGATLTNAQVEAMAGHSSGGLIEDLETLGVSLFALG